MQGLWLGLKDAKITERGEFFGEGSFDVQIERLQFKNSDQGKGLLFIGEFRILTSTSSDDPFDSLRTWILKMQNQAAPGNLKGLLVAAFGKDHHKDLDWLNRVFGPNVDNAIGNLAGPANPLRGQFLHLETKVGQTSGKTTGGVRSDFTYHNWSRFNFEAEHVPVPMLDHLLTMPASASFPSGPAIPPGPPPGATMSPDGRNWWNGTAWIPVQVAALPPPPPPSPGPPPGVTRSPDGRYWLNPANQWVAVQ